METRLFHAIIVVGTALGIASCGGKVESTTTDAGSMAHDSGYTGWGTIMAPDTGAEMLDTGWATIAPAMDSGWPTISIDSGPADTGRADTGWPTICTPISCAAVAPKCGTITDACGGILNCPCDAGADAIADTWPSITPVSDSGWPPIVPPSSDSGAWPPIG
jgi:hypothetical protein